LSLVFFCDATEFLEYLKSGLVDSYEASSCARVVE
jgi:hypothetical protein